MLHILAEITAAARTDHRRALGLGGPGGRGGGRTPRPAPPANEPPRSDHRTPLVLGTPALRGSGATAARSARATALNWASTRWCGLRPVTSRCRQMPADDVTDSKKCLVSVVS